MTRGPALSDLLDSRWAQLGSRAAIREGDREINYRELLGWSQALSGVIEPALREPGRRVALLLPNSAAFVAALFAVARLGGVAAPLSTHYRSQELAYYLDDLDAAAVLADSLTLEPLRAIVPRLRRPPALFEASGWGARLVLPGAGDARPVRTADSAPLIQQYTSGSTGVPKRVVRTHSSLLAELEALHTLFETGPADRFLGVAPFSHVNGLVRTMMSAVYAGATLYPVADFKRREMLDLVASERITFLGAVPQIFSILSQMPGRGGADLASLRIAFSSSAPLLAADNRRFRDRYGIVLRQLYGSSETGTISYNRDPSPESSIDTVGQPLPGVRVEVLDDAGRTVSPGVEGELAISSPFAASGYLDNETATRESFRAGVYLSGDLGTCDARGVLRITGRKKLMLNRGGFKVNPYEVEAAIREHPGVREVAVYGMPGAHGDDLVCAALVLSGPCTAEEIMAHCRERIADFKIPARIEIRDSLPKSATGKLLRSQL